MNLSPIVLSFAAMLSQVQAAHAEAPVLTEARTVKYLDARFEPTARLRVSLLHTLSERQSFEGVESRFTLDSSIADASMFGHRSGIALEQALLGLRGRFDKEGIYYQVRADLWPRDRFGVRTEEYLFDAYVGWDHFTVVDLRAGLMSPPMGPSWSREPELRTSLYFPMHRTLMPERMVGLRISTGDPWSVARLHVGAYTPLFQGDASGFDSVLITGRVEFRLSPILELAHVTIPDFGLELVLGSSVGWTPRFETLETEHRWFGADLSFTIWRFNLAAEFVVKDFYEEPLPTDTSRPERGLGWHVELGTELLPKWLSLVLRVEENDGDETVRGRNGDLSSLELRRRASRWFTATLALSVVDHAAISLEYTHRQGLEGTSWHNDRFALVVEGFL